MSEKEVENFILNASKEEFLILRDKLSELNNVTFESFIKTLNKIIDWEAV